MNGIVEVVRACALAFSSRMLAQENKRSVIFSIILSLFVSSPEVRGRLTRTGWKTEEGMKKAPGHDGCGALGVDDSDRVHHVGVLKVALLLQRAQLGAAKREREFLHGVAPSFVSGVLVRFAQPRNASASTRRRARPSPTITTAPTTTPQALPGDPR